MGRMPSRNRRLPRGQSWPLTLTDVNGGLGDAWTLVKPPRFEEGGLSDVVLVVSWIPAGYRYCHPSVVGIDVTVRPVRSTDRSAARSLLRSQALPQLREWVERTQTAADTWRWDRRVAYWRYAEEELRFAGDRPE